MLPFQITQQKDAVEVFFCKPFGMLKCHRLHDETSKYLTMLLLTKTFDVPKSEMPPEVRMLQARLLVLDYTLHLHQ